MSFQCSEFSGFPFLFLSVVLFYPYVDLARNCLSLLMMHVFDFCRLFKKHCHKGRLKTQRRIHTPWHLLLLWNPASPQGTEELVWFLLFHFSSTFFSLLYCNSYILLHQLIKTWVLSLPHAHVEMFVKKYGFSCLCRNGTPRQPLLVPLSRACLVFDTSQVPTAALDGLAEYSHCWILYVFHLNTNADKVWGEPANFTFKAKVCSGLFLHWV